MKLTSTREFTYQREIYAPYESVLTILQDPYRLCSHSPHFAGMAPDDSPTNSNDTHLPNSPLEGREIKEELEPSRKAPKEGRLSTTQWYWISDRIPLLGSLKTTIKIHAKISPVEGGVETEVEAGFGTRVRTSYTLERKAGEGSVCVLREATVVEALSLMMPYVWKTLENGHMYSFDSIQKELEKPSS